MTQDLLTEREHFLVQELGNIASVFCAMFPGEWDRAEFVSHIHACQNAVLSQASARAYPDRYRRMDLDPSTRSAHV
jgi:hypothetical protein